MSAVEHTHTDDAALSTEDLAMIDRAWEIHKAALPVAVVIDDNQPGRTAIIEILAEPPTLVVGTMLYAGPKAVGLSENNAQVSDTYTHMLAALKQAKRLTDNINEFGACTDAELYDAAWSAIETAIAKSSSQENTI